MEKKIKFTLSMLLLFAMALLSSVLVIAQTPVDIQRNKVLSTAYKYRKDINSKVLEKTKKWEGKVGILHTDWIENLHGRSIDLDGNELFPHYNYTGLVQYCDSFFVMTVNGKKGVVTRSGVQLTKFDYWGFDFSRLDQGVIFAKHNAISTGGVDVYSQLGYLIYTLDDFKDLAVGYDVKTNQIFIQFADNNGNRQNIVCYPDGIMVGEDSEPHPSMVVTTIDDAKRFDAKEYERNKWMSEFRKYYSKGKYKEAHFCLEYYNDYEKQILRSQETKPNFYHFAFDLKCRKELKDYGTVVSIVRGNDLNHRTPRGLQFNPAERQLKFSPEASYDSDELNEIAHLVSDINDTYTSSFQLFKEREIRRQERAQTWALLGMAALSAASSVASGVANMNSGTATSSRQDTQANVNATAAPVGSSATVSSNNSSAPEQKKSRTCSVCKGTGSETHETYMGSAVAGKKKWCSQCGKDVYYGHSHRTCTTCRGTGQITY